MAVREAMMSVEDKKEKELSTPNVGVWVEKWAPILPATGYLTEGLTTNALVAGQGGPGGGNEPPPPGPDPIRFDRPGRGGPRGGRPDGNPIDQLRGRASAVSSSSNTNVAIHYVLLTCRSVNMSKTGPAANTSIAEAVADELKGKTNYFEANMTKVIGDILGADTTNLTISFQVQVKLLRPMKL